MSPTYFDFRICENYLTLNETIYIYTTEDFEEMYVCESYASLAQSETLYFDGFQLSCCGGGLLPTHTKFLNTPVNLDSPYNYYFCSSVWISTYDLLKMNSSSFM